MGTNVLARTWNPPLYLTPVMPAYWYLQFPCQSFPVPGPDQHKHDSLLTLTKHNPIAIGDRSSFPRIPAAKRCCPTGLGIQHSLSAGLGSGCRQNLQRKLYFSRLSVIACVCTVHSVCTLIFPLCNFDHWQFFTEVCFTHLISFAGNHHWRCQLLPVSGPA